MPNDQIDELLKKTSTNGLQPQHLNILLKQQILPLENAIKELTKEVKSLAKQLKDK